MIRRLTFAFALVSFVLPGAVAAQAPAGDPELKEEFDEAFQLALALHKERKWAEALPHCKYAAELAPKALGPDHPRAGSILSGLGDCYFELGHVAEAERAYRASLVIREKHVKQFPLPCAGTLANLAVALSRQGRYDEAVKFQQRAAEIEDQALPPDHPQRHRRTIEIAKIYLRAGRSGDALEILRRSVKRQDDAFGPDHPGVGDSLVHFARACLASGEFREAETQARRAVRLAETARAKDASFVADAREALGEAYQENQKFEEATAEFRRSLAQREASLGKNHPRVAVTLTRLAKCLFNLPSGGEPETLLRRSLAILDKPGSNEIDLSVTLEAMTVWRYRLGQFDDAEKFAERSVTLLETARGKKDVSLVLARQWLGIVQFERHRYAEAEASFRRALELAEEKYGSDDFRVAGLLNDLARVCSKTNRLNESVALQLRSVGIDQKRFSPLHPGVVTSEHNLAIYLGKSGKRAEAKRLLESCLRKSEAAGDDFGAGRNLESLAYLSMVERKPREAIALQQRVLEIQQESLRNVFGFASESTMLTFLERRAGSLPTLVSMANAEHHGHEADDNAAEVACTWTLRLQGIVFDTVYRYRQARQTSSDPEFKKTLDEYLALKQRVAAAALSAPAKYEPTKGGVEQWRKQLDQLESELNGALAAKDNALSNPSNVTAAAVRAKLPPKSALVVYVHLPPRNFGTDDWGPHRLMAFVMTPSQKSARLVDLGSTAEVDAAIDSLRREFDDFQSKVSDCETAKEAHDLEKVQEPLFRRKAAALYGMVVAPLAKDLGGAELLYLVTDGGLNRLPFDALVDGGGKYLAETRRCVYLSSGRDLLRPDETPAKGTVIFAGPDFKASSADRQAVADKLLGKKELVASRGGRGLEVRSAGWKSLPGAAAEAGDIRETLAGTKFGPVKTYTGAEAMEEVLKAMPPPRLLHLATHGFYLDHQKDVVANDDDSAGAGSARARLKKQDNPLLRSGIVLAGANTVGDEGSTGDDGWVTAEEIGLLNLHGTELVVLSACQTGLGDVRTGEGVFGLRRAFLYAGARSLLTSLFEVPDAETRELMQRFYQGLKAGQTKSASLNAAQRAMIDRRRQSHGAAHPFYWASFVLIGDPR